MREACQVVTMCYEFPGNRLDQFEYFAFVMCLVYEDKAVFVLLKGEVV